MALNEQNTLNIALWCIFTALKQAFAVLFYQGSQKACHFQSVKGLFGFLWPALHKLTYSHSYKYLNIFLSTHFDL